MSSNRPSRPDSCQVCSACGVAIDAEENVHFAFGPAGTRERLYARVCRFTNDGGCLNKGDRPITANDCYGKADELMVLPEPQPLSLDRRAA